MTKTKSFIASLTMAVLLTSLTLNFNACTEQTPFSANSDESTTTLAKVRTNDNSYPQSTSGVVRFHKAKKQYRGLSLDLPNGSTFYVLGGALTPPADIAFGDPVTITMTCEKNSLNNELLFTFGPSGSQFSPAAVIELNWKDLGMEGATLYYVDENGNYIEQEPDKINLQGKTMMIQVDHFSRYAIGAE